MWSSVTWSFIKKICLYTKQNWKCLLFHLLKNILQFVCIHSFLFLNKPLQVIIWYNQRCRNKPLMWFFTYIWFTFFGLFEYPEKECQSWIKDYFSYFLSSCTNITVVFKNIFFTEIHQTKWQTKGCPRFSFFFWNIFNLLYDLLLIIIYYQKQIR